ncbi:hypothetical protein HanXRQr2_Chr10g0455941 [Helianthus annuus]|uniref:Uncharacterized protein n=1 Tax=Helianthus annuus TaxID=4232 RepID=A0A251TMV1_HELAN|nr:hypothetical protein HanXRQr2_Chr10g0455941 [Helianthus annuus]
MKEMNKVTSDILFDGSSETKRNDIASFGLLACCFQRFCSESLNRFGYGVRHYLFDFYMFGCFFC